MHEGVFVAADPSANWLGFGSRGECNRAYLDFSYCVWEELHAVSVLECACVCGCAYACVAGPVLKTTFFSSRTAPQSSGTPTVSAA